jgi:tetratricopeptide (TPR) repeat protein
MNNAALLEAVFTAREDLARTLLDRIRDSASSETRHYSLVVGPRGIGKTHLVSLLYYRVKADAALSERLRIAWLLEDPWRITSYPLLLNEILAQLAREYEVPELAARLGAVADLPPHDREGALEGELVGFLNGRVLMLLLENLDAILEALDDDGQKKLRAFFQNTAAVSILATAPSLTPDVTDRERAFYGFFRHYTLHPFTLQECLDMLVRISRQEGDEALAKKLQSSTGRARIRAIHHLGGGNPRIYVIFHQFVTAESLDELVVPFMKLVQELTPYYQSRMQTLSPQQRGIVDVIRRSEGPIAVKEIAKLAYSTSQSVSKDLQKLRELGFVDANKFGRESLYDLREPLMRICLSAKEQRGGAIPLFVQFLRIWFTRQEREQLETRSFSDAVPFEEYEAAIRATDHRERLVTEMNRKRAQEYLSAGDEEMALAYLDSLLDVAPEDWWAWGSLTNLLERQGRLEELGRRVQEHIAAFPEDAFAWNLLGYCEGVQGRPDKALAASARALELDPVDPIYRSNHLSNLRELGLSTQVLEFARESLELPELPNNANYHRLRAEAQDALGLLSEAVVSLCRAVRLRSNYSDWRTLHAVLEKLGAESTARALALAATEVFPKNGAAWTDRVRALLRAGSYAEAAVTAEQARKVAPRDVDVARDALGTYVWAGKLDAAERLLASWDYSNIDEDRDVISVRLSLAIAKGDLARCRELLERAVELTPAGKDLPSPQRVVELSPAAGTWPEYAALWFEVYSRHGRLGELGSAMVKRLFVDQSILRARDALESWLTVCQEAGKNFPELQLPLRLMAAGVGFLRTGSRDSLLALPLEQRTLLEPEIERYLRVEGKEANREDALVKAVIAHALRQGEERNKGASLARAVQVGTEDVARLFERFGEIGPSTALDHLLFDRWGAPIERDDAVALVKRAVLADVNLAMELCTREVFVTDVEQCLLRWPDTILFQVNLLVSGERGAVDIVERSGATVVLDGSSGRLLSAGPSSEIAANPGIQAEWLFLFCSGLRAKDGRFPLVSPLDRELSDLIRKNRPDIEVPYRNPRRLPSDEGKVVYAAELVHGDALFAARFEVDGLGVDIVHDSLVAASVGRPREGFHGPVRVRLRS